MDNQNNHQEPTFHNLLDSVKNLTIDTEQKFSDVLSAVNNFSTHTDQQFNKMNQRFDKVENRLDKVESTMVTKDYLDDKLSDLRGDLVILMRKEDTKLTALVSLMEKKQLLTSEEAGKIITMEPFARNPI
ncbi:MAG: hypothetical protein A3B89_03185 [Candidatus Buchananbacteria bacterium RIFCSPHIGHO2_02_FULL_40_13]|uniref:Uncharacterized protein n=1 Tax=Candidatus Buchananbacteria bacterium RIFCSPLOWO2_01_FULL_39_33 TaxID=1797543 RepID=A0A1G1YIB1_9BACT|nr:MAG: hypothetical protein A2820_01430 [Candidatus Buchananbacteria bacterium RIFCSPHIGHO2_01_FULL_40_35]OGY50193.1 MAG: hypothetical protein A3B89_03185 [Candidatus Buchananbacteria bacterium RIFCSPHIGHO2_02_FULL_40_13]OGY51450.1 MAG: hypothetical protein A3A02_04660 [Candidatus Buchananbacteria bacterium RIFCSPLOWO2_01_FULL_39_33]